MRLNTPISYTTINSKDVIAYEIHTTAPKEFNLPNNARVRWKLAPLKGRKYNFIIGIDLLNFLNAFINIEKKVLILNHKENVIINNPYQYEEVSVLESSSKNLENLKLDHLNEEEVREIKAIVQRFSKLFFKEGDQLTSTTHEEEVRKQIKEMEEQGIIRKSNSRYSSPLIVIPKKIDNSGKKKFRIVTGN